MFPNNVHDLVKSLADEEGRISPDLVVAIAEPEDHPLHGQFVWDNKIAGHQFRLGQARALIRHVMSYDYETIVEYSYNVPHFIRDPEAPAHEQGYRAVTEIRKDPLLARRSMNRELTVALAHLRRAKGISMALGFESEIDDLIAQIIGLQRKAA